MPKHRQAGFAVVREKENYDCHWEFDGIVGVYLSVQRAEEVAAATIQKYLDLGMSPDDPEYRCKINPTNWYDE
jgi:hypothetical protein